MLSPDIHRWILIGGFLLFGLSGNKSFAREMNIKQLDSIRMEIDKLLSYERWQYYFFDVPTVKPNASDSYLTKKSVTAIRFNGDSIQFQTSTASQKWPVDGTSKILNFPARDFTFHFLTDSVTQNRPVANQLPRTPYIGLGNYYIRIYQTEVVGWTGKKIAEISAEQDKNFNRLYDLLINYQVILKSQHYKNCLEEFEAGLVQYRLTNSTGEMSEEQRKYVVQANSQNEKKAYLNALSIYQKAMEIDPYAYPEGYYNMALISAIQNNYAAAILNMKKYLLLAPDSEDARAAQDKIYEWELETEDK